MFWLPLSKYFHEVFSKWENMLPRSLLITHNSLLITHYCCSSYSTTAHNTVWNMGQGSLLANVLYGVTGVFSLSLLFQWSIRLRYQRFHLPQWNRPHFVAEAIATRVLWMFWTSVMRFLTLTWTRNWEWYLFEKSSMAGGACWWLSVQPSNQSQQLILRWWLSIAKSNLHLKSTRLHPLLHRLTFSVSYLKSSFANCWMNLKRGIYCPSQ